MATYNPLQSTVLTSATGSVAFSGIDQGYTDLIIVCSFYKTTSGSPRVRFNGDTSSSTLYSQTILYGNGSSALSGKETSQNGYLLLDYFNPSTTNPNVVTLNLLNYSNTTTFKSILEKSGVGDVGTEASIGLYRSTNAITSITIVADAGSGVFGAGTTFDLYGIKSGAPQALGGDTVTTDGNYWYHTFRSTGAFIPQRPLTVDYLVVAGGGGGGNGIVSSYGSGGGGAGGLRSTVTATGGGGSIESALSLASSTSYTVTVGAGGATNTTGVNSVFSTITSSGGGRGGNANATNAESGGSGGGAGAQGASASGASSTTNQGFAGGNNAGGGLDGGGGGGGAGQVGANGSAGNSGNGGNGVAVAISGSSVTYAGGGGGGGGQSRTGTASGGTGGGGTGGGAGSPGSPAPTNGSANTGSGGGGGGRSTSGAAGGSGIVIVRYPV
jgi:hypothetical protein